MRHNMRYIVASGAALAVAICIAVVFCIAASMRRKDDSAAIGHVATSLNECDKITVRLIYGGRVDSPECMPVDVVGDNAIRDITAALALESAQPLVLKGKIGGMFPIVEVAIFAKGTKLLDFRLNGDILSVKREADDKPDRVMLSSLRAYKMLCTIGQAGKPK